MEPKPNGRPTIYTPALRDAICARLAAGQTLRAVCRDDDMPVRSTVHEWIIKDIGKVMEGEKVVEEGFSYHYALAREIGAEEIHDEIIEISDDSTNDYMEIVKKKRGGGEETKIVFDKEAVMRSRLRVDARQAYLANMAPKKYGRNVKVQSQALDKNGEPTDPSNHGIDGYIGQMAAALTKHGKDKE
jgi:hypothetical protein